MRRQDVVTLHTRLLEKQDESVSAILDNRLCEVTPDDARTVTDAAFLVKGKLELCEYEAAKFVLRRIRSAVGRHTGVCPLQISYAEGLMAFDHHRPAAEVLRVFAPGVEAARRARGREDLAFAVAILWRVALLELSLKRDGDARRHLDMAAHCARELQDPTMLGVVATARGWYEARRERWRAARTAFLGGLLLIDYEGRPRRLWSDLALGLAELELNAPPPHRMAVFDLLRLLDECAKAIGGLRAYPMYVDGGGSLHPRQLSSRLYAKGERHHLGSRHIPRAIRDELENARPLGCRRCGSAGSLVIDHVWFFSWGGGSGTPKRLNVRWLCRQCNTTRRNDFTLDADAYEQLRIL